MAKAVLNLENIDLGAGKLENKVSLLPENDLYLEDDEVAENEEDIVDGKIKLGINYESSIYNINKEIDVEIPEITEENSIDLFAELAGILGSVIGGEIPSDTIVEPPVKDGINVILNGSYIEFPDVVPQIIDGRTLVPIGAISEEMGADVGYEHGNKDSYNCGQG